MRKILPTTVLIVMVLTVLIAGCGRQDTPELALSDIKQSIEHRDYGAFSERVDVPVLLDEAYDDATISLARRVKELGAAYPDDPFFRNAPEFIVTYNEMNRLDHMKFVKTVIAAFFDRELIAPERFDDDTIRGTAAELRHYYSTAVSEVESVVVEGAYAEARLKVSFESLYAAGRYELSLVLSFEREGERWRLIEIKNVDEIIIPLVDIAEILWPDQFNF